MTDITNKTRVEIDVSLPWSITDLDPWAWWDLRRQDEADGEGIETLVDLTGGGRDLEWHDARPVMRHGAGAPYRWGDYDEQDGANPFFRDLDNREDYTWLASEGGTVLAAVRLDADAWDAEDRTTTSPFGFHYAFQRIGVFFQNGQDDEEHNRLAVRDANGDNVIEQYSEPGYLGARDGDRWTTIGYSWDADEVVFWKHGRVFSRHDHGGELADPYDPDTDTPPYPWTIGAHRSGRWPWFGDIGAVALVRNRIIDEDEAANFHRWCLSRLREPTVLTVNTGA